MKRILKYLGLGAVAGLALNQIVSYIVSATLQLGYYMPFPAALPERVGGEMNAVLCQMALFMLLGMGAGVAVSIGGQFRGRLGKRLLLLASAGAAAIAPAVALATYMIA